MGNSAVRPRHQRVGPERCEGITLNRLGRRRGDRDEDTGLIPVVRKTDAGVGKRGEDLVDRTAAPVDLQGQADQRTARTTSLVPDVKADSNRVISRDGLLDDNGQPYGEVRAKCTMELAQASPDLPFQGATLIRIGEEDLDRDGPADTDYLAKVTDRPDERQGRGGDGAPKPRLTVAVSGHENLQDTKKPRRQPDAACDRESTERSTF